MEIREVVEIIKSSYEKYLKKYVRHILRALFCQLWFILCENSAYGVMSHYAEEASVREGMWSAALTLLNVLAISALLWFFFDETDDYTFDGYIEGRDRRHLLCRAEILASFAISVALSVSAYRRAFLGVLAYTRLSPSALAAISLVLAIFFASLIRLLLVLRANKRLRIFLEAMECGGYKHERVSVKKRVVQTIFMLLSVVFCSSVGFSYLLLILVSLIESFALIMFGAFGLITFVIFAIWLIGRLRVVLRWSAFFKKLKCAKKLGEIEYKIEGHPYLATIFPRVYSGILLTDKRVKGSDEPKRYRVGIANCVKRRSKVFLCEDGRYQILHEITLPMQARVIGRMRSPGNAVGDMEDNFSFFSWASSYPIDFPCGEGEKILLIDPAPYRLYVSMGNAGWLDDKIQKTELDNASKVFDYRVFTKNAFFNYVDRM